MLLMAIPMRIKIWKVAISCLLLLIPELVSGQSFARQTISTSQRVTVDQHVVEQTDGYETEVGILYRQGDDLTDYMKEKCRLDIYYPSNI